MKPELLVTPSSVENSRELLEIGADALVIGEQKFGLRLAGEFVRSDVESVIEYAHSLGKKVYVSMNAIFHNDKINEIREYLTFLNHVKPDAVIFGDPAILMIAREVAPHLPLHWNTETTSTNWFTCNYWGKRGAKRAVLAREINMEAIIETKENAEVEIEVQVHGMTCMFQSKRNLLGNYFEYRGKSMTIENQRDIKKMLLYDDERNNKYPIYEDENGTHIMSPNDICIIDELQELIEAGVDSFKIDGVLQSNTYLKQVTELYRIAIDLAVDHEEEYDLNKSEMLNKIQQIQPKHRPLDTGFFFKETVY
jgi:putative protease